MGMGLVDDSEFESQLSNVTQSRSIPKSIPSTPNEVIEGEAVIEDIPSKGRKEGDNNVPESLRNLIGITAQTEGRKEAIALAKMFGVSPSSTSAYSNSATSTKTYNQPDNKISDVILKRKSQLTKKALNKLGTSLDKITDDKLDALDAKELASITKDMSAVIKNLEPPSTNGKEDGRPNVAFVLYRPEIRHEDSYDSLPVSE